MTATVPTQDFHEGMVAETTQEAAQLEAQGYTKCHNQLCNWWIAPQAVEQVAASGQNYRCPQCGLSYDLNTAVGHYPREQPTQFAPGGRTIAGIALAEQAQIGEDLIEHMRQIPGYGPITWWHQGGANVNSPLDGAVEGWGVEVKTINADAQNLRFMPGRPRERMMKNQAAEKMGAQGVLGILVLLNYRTSKADIYVREFPLAPQDVPANGGWATQGVGAYRHHTGTQLVAEVPFSNPLLQPNHPAPAIVGSQPQGNDDTIPF